MVTISIKDEILMIELSTLDKWAALKSQLAFPLQHVQGATIDPNIVREAKGLRAPGTYIPGVITAGTFYHHGEKVFWDVHKGMNAIVIRITGESYNQLVVEVDNPLETVALINAAVQKLQ